eukprot:889374-Rhodomonas_salina.1
MQCDFLRRRFSRALSSSSAAAAAAERDLLRAALEKGVQELKEGPGAGIHISPITLRACYAMPGTVRLCDVRARERTCTAAAAR